MTSHETQERGAFLDDAVADRVVLLRFGSCASFQQADKFREVSRADIRHGPELEAASRPTHHVITLPRLDGLCGARPSRARPHEHIDEMFSPLVDQSGDLPPFEIIETPTNQ